MQSPIAKWDNLRHYRSARINTNVMADLLYFKGFGRGFGGYVCAT